jgi:RNA polymerase sigma-70 factor (ECF subfamily)
MASLKPAKQPGPPDPSDANILAGLRAGDDEAFERLVRLHSGRMLAVSRRFLPVEDDARDAVQDAFLSAFRAIDRFEGDAKLSTWLHRIVVNACLMKLRSRRRRPESRIEDMLPGFLEDGHFDQPVAEWQKSADALIESDENRKLVQEAILALPDNYRTVLLLRDIEGYDTETTAKELDMSVAAVKTRLHRARQALRSQLDPHFR